MSDPVTIGDLAASALALAAPEVIKSAVGEAVKDAYKALKEKIAIWASGDVEALTNEPDSKGRQLTVAEKIDKQSPDDQSVVEALAKALMDALEARRQVIPRLPPRPASLGFRRISYRLVAISTPRQIFPSSRLALNCDLLRRALPSPSCASRSLNGFRLPTLLTTANRISSV